LNVKISDRRTIFLDFTLLILVRYHYWSILCTGILIRCNSRKTNEILHFYSAFLCVSVRWFSLRRERQ